MSSGAAGTRRSISSPASTAKWMPCHTAGPTRCGRPAPVNWATKVEGEPAVTWRRPNGNQNHITAGKEAAIARGSYQDSRTVSTNTWTVMKLWLTMSGAARDSSSRLPPAACLGGTLASDPEAGDGDGAGGSSAVFVLSTRFLL